jgi:hypothetical protein
LFYFGERMLLMWSCWLGWKDRLEYQPLAVTYHPVEASRLALFADWTMDGQHGTCRSIHLQDRGLELCRASCGVFATAAGNREASEAEQKSGC